jgi:lipopolysaccharide transport system ATP-binding protein
VNAIEFDRVSKVYSVYASPRERVRELLVLGRRSYHSEAWALRETSFSVPRGEFFCFIGENGAGKSTVLQLIAGILEPSAGAVRVHGRVSALLELGSGFNHEYTGRENVYLNGAVLGLSARQIETRMRTIEEFADIGEFLDRPVKTYSSGMVVRLAFAVAVHTDPEILLVDEALAVGDTAFRQRSMRKIEELRTGGATIILVSHSMAEVKAVAERVLWLERGAVRQVGDPEEVVGQYLQAMARKDAAYEGRLASPSDGGPEPVAAIPNIDHRHGDGRAQVAGIAVLDPAACPVSLLEPGTRIVVRITARACAELRRPAIGFVLRNHLGIDFAGTDTERERFALPPMGPGGTCTVDFHLKLPELYPGFFSFSPMVADGAQVCDWIDNAITVQMAGGRAPVYGYVHLPCRIELNSGGGPVD